MLKINDTYVLYFKDNTVTFIILLTFIKVKRVKEKIFLWEL